MAAKLIDIELAKESFIYDAESGILTWNSRPLSHFIDERAFKIWNTRFAGTVAGTIDTRGTTPYISVTFNKKHYFAHRIIWAIAYGEDADINKDLDHIDGNGLNNKLDNLRLLDRLGSARNCKIQSNNKSGINGVSWDESRKRWQARAYEIVDGKHKSKLLGRFLAIEDAAKARKEWEDEKGWFTERHGK